MGFHANRKSFSLLPRREKAGKMTKAMGSNAG